jgi:hypothetical protein
MATLIAGILAVALVYTVMNIIKGADPKWLAKITRGAGGILALAAAFFVGVKGEIAVAIPLALFGAGLLGWSPLGAQLGSAFSGWGGGLNGQKSQVRSQFIELTLDHHSGALEGLVTAGPEAGRVLSSFSLDELIALGRSFDAQSWSLLEAYLDRRFAGWRQHAHDEAAGGSGEARRAASSGKMSVEEAYQILGLKPGAGREEISRAHRGLMKKLHPDQGGSTYLAARVNEAKDTLLRNHH